MQWMHLICMQTPRRLRSVVRARVFGLYVHRRTRQTHTRIRACTHTHTHIHVHVHALTKQRSTLTHTWFGQPMFPVNAFEARHVLFRVCTPFARLHRGATRATAHSTHGWMQRVRCTHTHTHTHTQRQTLIQERAHGCAQMARPPASVHVDARCYVFVLLVHVHVHVQPAAPACIAAKHDVEHTRSRWVTLTLPTEREIWQLF